jgi:hypothetical protein
MQLPASDGLDRQLGQTLVREAHRLQTAQTFGQAVGFTSLPR